MKDWLSQLKRRYRRSRRYNPIAADPRPAPQIKWSEPARSPKAVLTVDEDIKTFIFTLLNPKAQLSKHVLDVDGWLFLQEAIVPVKDRWPIIAEMIQRTDYSHFFVNTIYWKLIAAEVKRRAAWVCQRCERQNTKLEAHHKTYEHHGSEHLHMDDLEALCLVCHAMDHDLVIEAVIREQQWRIQQDGSQAWRFFFEHGISLGNKDSDELLTYIQRSEGV